MINFSKLKKTNQLIIFLTFIFFITINLIYFYIILKQEHNVYAFNELFVNYQAGFIRRGLLGEIAWQLNKYFLLDPKKFFSLFFLTIHLSQLIFFYYLCKKFLFNNLFFIFIFFSPTLLLFHIYNVDLYFLKDSIIKLGFSIHAFTFCYFFIYKNDKIKYWRYLSTLIIPILFLVILIHEYQIFYLSLHFLISLGSIHTKAEFKKLLKIYMPLIISILLIIFFFGNEVQFDTLSGVLEEFNVKLNPYLGGGLYSYIGGFYKWHFFYFSYRDFINLLFSIILSILIFYVIFQSLIKKKLIKFNIHYQKNYLLFFLPTIIPFLLTSDHGRNLTFISYHLVIFYSTLNFNYFKINKLTTKIFQNILFKILIILLLFFFTFMWKLDQMAGFGLQGKPNDIFQSSLFAEIIKFVKYLYFYIDSNIISLPEINL